MYRKYVKRIFDILLSVIFLPFALIIIFICGIIIKLDDGGPVFYLGKRLGMNGIIFNMYKLRTMKVNSPDLRMEDGSTWNSEYDPRVTRIGKFLRKSSLDEVPQLFNILKGDMSIIGPRPDTPDWLEKYSRDEMIILTVLPGISGYNQVFFRNSVNGKEKVKNDVFYVKNISLIWDLKIFLRSIVCVFRHENVFRTVSANETIHNAL